MTLVEHDGDFCIRVNGQQLMHSKVATSEFKLGTVGCERQSAKELHPKVPIGGAGLGFPLRSVLQTAGPLATVHVVELFPEIVGWNHTFMAGFNGDCLKNERVTAITEDPYAPSYSISTTTRPPW